VQPLPLFRRERDGYIDVWAPEHPLARRDGYVFEHRMLAWDAGMFTDPSLQVHHRNHVRTDNRLENFEIKTIEDHARLHADEGTIVNQFGTWQTGTGFRRRHQEWAEELGDRHCEVCGRDINGMRLDATVCGTTCRVARWKRAHRG